MRNTPSLDGPLAAPADPAVLPAARAGGRGAIEWRMLLRRREVIVALILIVGSVLFNFTHPVFLSGANIQSILVNTAVVATVSIGMTMIIVTGGIDVSVGSMLGLGMYVAVTLELGGHTLIVVMLACVGVGVLLGLFNGVMVAYGRIHPIIVTLGMLNIIRAVQVKLLGRYITAPPTTQGRDLALATFLGIPAPWWIAMVLAALATVFLTRRPLGRHIYAVGGNPEASRLSGINVRWVLIFCYAITGLLVGFASVIQLGLGGTVAASSGENLELSAIAATVIGGTSILGGRGTVIGALLGALLVESVHNGMIAIGSWSWIQNFQLLDGLVIGGLIVLAVGLDVLQNRKATRV